MGNIKHVNVCIASVPREEKIKKVIENLFEKIAENFHNLEKDTDIQDQVTLREQNKINPKRKTLGHSLIKRENLKIRK